jgi:sorbitol-specific phosphotransferase system component IIC
MIVLPVASPFVVLVLAALAAVLGLRKTSVWMWFIGAATIVYAFQGYITEPLKIAL